MSTKVRPIAYSGNTPGPNAGLPMSLVRVPREPDAACPVPVRAEAEPLRSGVAICHLKIESVFPTDRRRYCVTAEAPLNLGQASPGSSNQRGFVRVARRDKNNIAKYWWDRRLPGLSLMHADFTSHDYAPHTHNAIVIAVTELGGAEINSRNTTEFLCPSVLFVSNPEEPQSARMGESRRWRYRSIYLTRPSIDAIAHDLGVETVPDFTRNIIDDADLIGRFTQLHRTLETGRDDFDARERLIDAFGELFRRHGSGGGRIAAAPRDRVLVGKVIALMRERYSEGLQLADLASAVAMTSFQLIGLFRRTVGLTPHAYLIRVQLDMACRYLRRGYPLAEAAVEAGFYDQSAMTKHFKRWFGITPLAVRRGRPVPKSRCRRRARPQFQPIRQARDRIGSEPRGTSRHSDVRRCAHPQIKREIRWKDWLRPHRLPTPSPLPPAPQSPSSDWAASAAWPQGACETPIDTIRRLRATPGRSTHA